MKSVLLLLPLLTSVLFCSAQNQLKIVMDTKPKGSVIRLSKYVGDMKVALDSMLYRGESEIGFNYNSRFSDGIYALDVNSLETFQFVIIDQENITAHIYESGSGMAFKSNQSKENDAFNIMLNLSEVYSKSMDSMGIALNQLSDFDPEGMRLKRILSPWFITE